MSGQIVLGRLPIVEDESPVDEFLLPDDESDLSEPGDDPVQGVVDLPGTTIAFRIEGRRKPQVETGLYSRRFTLRTALSGKSAPCEG